MKRIFQLKVVNTPELVQITGERQFSYANNLFSLLSVTGGPFTPQEVSLSSGVLLKIAKASQEKLPNISLSNEEVNHIRVVVARNKFKIAFPVISDFITHACNPLVEEPAEKEDKVKE